MLSKKCFKCSEVKDISEFYKHKMMADGHLNKCKACTKSDVGKHRIENLEKVRAYDRNRAKNPERSKSASEISARWRKEDSRRMRCHNAVARAVRKGTLVRLACERCRSSKAYAHHESYDHPLVIVWLCQPCHKQRHKEMAIAGIEP